MVGLLKKIRSRARAARAVPASVDDLCGKVRSAVFELCEISPAPDAECAELILRQKVGSLVLDVLPTVCVSPWTGKDECRCCSHNAEVQQSRSHCSLTWPCLPLAGAARRCLSGWAAPAWWCLHGGPVRRQCHDGGNRLPCLVLLHDVG